MKIALLIAGPVCILLAFGGPVQAGLGELGDRGFAAPVLQGGTAPDSAPMMIAKAKSKKKKKKKSDDDAGGGGGTVHIDPNTAKLSELKVLPLVDDKTAQAIIAHRPYKTAGDLANVPEVGPAKYRIFKHLIEIKNPEGTAPGEGSAAGGAEQAP